jgi:hypothetical protein
MDDASERLVNALEDWERVADAASPDDAPGAFDEASLQLFWQRWPQISSWGGAVWRRLNAELADAARPHDESEFHDVGGEG